MFFNFIMFSLIFLYFNLKRFLFTAIYSVHDSINYLCASVTNAVKSFTCGGLSSLLYFNFIMFSFFYFSIFRLAIIYDSINYFCATATNAVKKFFLRRAFVAP